MSINFSIKAAKDHCIFCNRKYSEKKFIFINYSNDVSICDDCVLVCHQTLKKYNIILHDHKYYPKDIFKLIRQFVIGQDESLRSVSTTLFKHLIYSRHADYIKDNHLLMGSTGSGKTYMLEVASRMLDIPMIVCDCTTLTATGYVGEDVDNIIHKLLQVTNFNIKKAETGIVFLDEIDKIATNAESSLHKDIGGKSVQYELLRLIEGTTMRVYLDFRKHYGRTIDFNTRNVLFFAAGAFTGIKDIAGVSQMASNDITSHTFVNESESFVMLNDALKTYGIIPELLARFSQFSVLNKLTKEDYLEILNKPDGYVAYYRTFFEGFGVQLEIDQNALDCVTVLACKMDVGARALYKLLGKLFNKYIFNIEDYVGRTIFINEEEVRGVLSGESFSSDLGRAGLLH